MTEILRSVIVIILVYLTARMLYLFTLRTVTVLRLLSLGRKGGITVKISPRALLSIFKPSRRADAVIKVGETAYRVRFFSGRGSLSYVHFASERFAVVYSKIHFSISGLLSKSSRRGAARSVSSVDTARQRVHIIDRLTVDEKNEREVLIFDPTPAEVTYVTETKTSIKAAYTGDEVYGRMIFTPETFAIYIDRKRRELEYETAQRSR